MVYIIHWYQVPAEFQHDRVQTELAGWFSMIIVPRIFIYKPAFNLRIYIVPPQYDLDDENREDESRVGIPSLQDILARVRPSTSTGCDALSLWKIFIIFNFSSTGVEYTLRWLLCFHPRLRLRPCRPCHLCRDQARPQEVSNSLMMMMMMILTQVAITPSTWWPVPGHFIELLDLRPECEHVAGQPRLHLSSSASSWAATLWSPWMSPNTTGCSKLLPWLKACFWISSVLKHDIWEGNAPQQNCPQNSNP